MNASSRETRPSHGSCSGRVAQGRGIACDDALRRAPRAGTACRWCGRRSPVPRPRPVNSSRARTVSIAGRLRRVGSRRQRRPDHPLLAPVVSRLQEQRRLLRAPVDRDDRARLDDAGQVEELVVLAERLFAGPLGRALQDRDAVADLLHHLRAARREFLGRKDLGAGEDRLSRRERAERNHRGERAKKSFHTRMITPARSQLRVRGAGSGVRFWP